MSFCVAGVALQGIPSCFKTRQKLFCVAGAILLLHFQNMCCIFRGSRSTLDTSDVILRGRRSTLDVSCCVFSANHVVSAARSGDKVQIPWQAWHFVTCHETRRKPRTKRRFCSSCRAYWESRTNVSFSTCHTMCSCRFAWHGTLRHSTCVRCATLVRLKLPCLWEQSRKRVFFRRVTRCAHVVLRGMALCDIPHV